jgi:hypothetical protein
MNFVNDPILTQGLAISSQYVDENADETDQVLIGSYILFNCMSGYTNTDNNLNVICNANGQWSPFPTCIPMSIAMPLSISFMNCRIDFMSVSLRHINHYYGIKFRKQRCPNDEWEQTKKVLK